MFNRLNIVINYALNNTGNNCNEPGHNHQSTNGYRPTRPTVTTKRTTTYQPTQPTTRPSTTKRPFTHPTYSTHFNHTHFTHKPTTSTTTARPITTTTMRTTTRRPTTTTRKSTQTYPPRPSSTPNPTGSSGNIGVQPPSTQPTTTPNPNVFIPGNQPPFFIIPFPFPMAPSCPCYYFEPSNSSSQSQQQMQQNNQNTQIQWQSQHQYAIGFIPVLFLPHCANNHSNQVSGQYLQTSYPCAQCNQSTENRNGRALDLLNENFSSGDSFKQVLALAGVDIFSNSLVKSPNRKSRARKLKRIQTVEEPQLNEFHHENQQDPLRQEK
jgi:hypothetical protein